jgi:5-methylthioribose kinase
MDPNACAVEETTQRVGDELDKNGADHRKAISKGERVVNNAVNATSDAALRVIYEIYHSWHDRPVVVKPDVSKATILNDVWANKPN